VSDQILAAEKAGLWGEALALYEQALRHEHHHQGSSDAAGNCAAITMAAADRALTGPGLPAADAMMLAAAAASDAGANATCAAVASGAASATYAAALINPLRVGQLRCLLQVGHHQSVLGQVDGLISRSVQHLLRISDRNARASSSFPGEQHAAAVAALATLARRNAVGSCGGGGDPDRDRCTNESDAAWSVTQLAALGLAASWRLGDWNALRGYLSVVDAAAAAGVRPLCPADQWEVRVEKTGSHQGGGKPQPTGGLTAARCRRVMFCAARSMHCHHMPLN
jgi:hypothetical protein